MLETIYIFVRGIHLDIFEKTKTYIYLRIHYSYWDGKMPLTRKARMVGSSLVLTIPSQLAKAHDIQDGDELEILPEGIGEFRIRKTKKKTKKI